jgi:hypothetical protein
MKRFLPALVRAIADPTPMPPTNKSFCAAFYKKRLLS